ncbi:MAG: ABC transporter substrate-binding protein [Verrucomicrobia bacterium]|nr:ABC transporter substrate-binding protein [Verrucomicrobiota bacterium]
MTNSNDRFAYTRRDALKLSAAALGFSFFAKMFPAYADADAITNATINSVGEMVSGAKFKKDGPYRIGFSNGFSGNTWRTEMLASIKKEAAQHKDLGDLIIVDGQGDITKQVNDIESLVSQNVDAILCIANSGSAVAPVLRDATKQGIVTVPFNLPVDGEAWTAYIGTDPEKKGNGLGKWLRGALNDSGKIVALGGLPGNSYTASAWKGAQNAFAGSKIEVLAFKDAYWEEDKAKVVMADLIAAYPDIDGVWCDGSQVAAGAMKALLAAKRPLVPVTGDDYNGLLKLFGQESANQPKFKIGLLSEPTWESVVALRTALNLLSGKDVAKRQVIEPKLITVENYKTYVRPELPDGVFVDTSLSEEELKQLFKA